MNFNYDILINNIEKIYNNCSLMSDIYANEYKNLYSYNLFENYINENFNILIEINSNEIIKKKYEFFSPTIFKIKCLLNIISLVIHVGYLYYMSQQSNLTYDDYINLFNLSNTNLFVCNDMTTIIDNLKKVSILNNLFVIVSVNIDTDSLNENLTFASSPNILCRTVANLNKLLESFSYIICSNGNATTYTNGCGNDTNIDFRQICKMLLKNNTCPIDYNNCAKTCSNSKIKNNNFQWKNNIPHKTIYISKAKKACTVSSSYAKTQTNSDSDSDSSSKSNLKKHSNTYIHSKSNDCVKFDGSKECSEINYKISKRSSKKNKYRYRKFKNIITKKLMRKIKRYKKLRLFNKCFLFVNVMLVILFFFEKINIS